MTLSVFRKDTAQRRATTSRIAPRFRNLSVTSSALYIKWATPTLSISKVISLDIFCEIRKTCLHLLLIF